MPNFIVICSSHGSWGAKNRKLGRILNFIILRGRHLATKNKAEPECITANLPLCNGVQCVEVKWFHGEPRSQTLLLKSVTGKRKHGTRLRAKYQLHYTRHADIENRSMFASWKHFRIRRIVSPLGGDEYFKEKESLYFHIYKHLQFGGPYPTAAPMG